jgi:flagellar hook-associated protein FlgK
MTGLYVPAWAERELAKKPAFDQAELDTLRAFYKAWEALHAIPKDKLHKKQAQEAAQTLVEQAHVLRRMYAQEPVQ